MVIAGSPLEREDDGRSWRQRQADVAAEEESKAEEEKWAAESGAETGTGTGTGSKFAASRFRPAELEKDDEESQASAPGWYPRDELRH